MNSNFKTVLLTVIALSLFTIALIEISGVSTKAIFHKKNSDTEKYDSASASLREKFKDDSIKLANNRALPKTTISFKDNMVDFGKITEGDSVSHSYLFTNTGNAPLIIADVQVSCGCTVPSYSKEPVQPGQQGKIDIVFHSKNKSGIQKKSVSVIANTDPETTVIKFETEVEKK